MMIDLVDDLRKLHIAGGQINERACVAMYVTTGDALAIRRAGVRALPVLLGADAWLRVPPGGWSAWLASLTSRQRVKKIRKEVRRFREAGYEIKHMPLAECYSKLALAAAATQLKYGHEGNPDDYLAALRRYVDGLGLAAKVAVCARRGDEPVGFCVYFVWADTIFLRWCGFDYKRLVDGAAEYFNLLYYSQIELAAECGARWIHAGIKSPEAKARRGAELRPLWLVDLVEDSVFARASDQVRRHNRRGYQRLAEDGQTAGSLVDQEAWQAFL
jgi:predicted N-acyltransferase